VCSRLIGVTAQHLGRRGVQASPHAHFHHGDVNPPAPEIITRQDRKELKVSQRFGQPLIHGDDGRRQILPGNNFAVHPDPLPDINQMGRREKAYGTSRRSENRGGHCRYGALAVGAGNEHCRIGAFRMAQGGKGGTDRTQIQADAQALQIMQIFVGDERLRHLRREAKEKPWK